MSFVRPSASRHTTLPCTAFGFASTSGFAFAFAFAFAALNTTFAATANAQLGGASSSAGSGSAALPSAVPATRAEVITGRVVGSNNVPASGAVVIATMAPDRLTFADTTDADGRYQLRMAHGTGDYLVYIAVPGYTAFRKRVTRPRADSLTASGTGAAIDSVYVVDAMLVSTVAQLSTIKVAARRATPQRITSNFNNETGAAESLPDAVDGALPVDAIGDISALAGLAPGVVSTSAGIAALGLGPSQTAVTLNGVQFSGAGMPRDVRTYTRVASSSFDPARGWFSGTNVNIDLAGPGLFATSRSRFTVDAPMLQSRDALSNAAGNRFTNLSMSYGADGPTSWEKRHFYNLGVQVDRRTSPFTSIVNAAPSLLQELGVASDSTAALMQALNTARIPVSRGALPTSRVTDNVMLLGRFERMPHDISYKANKTTYGITAIGQQTRNRITSIGTLSTPTRAGESTQQTGMLQGVFSQYFNKDFLNETRTIVSYSHREDLSPTALPEGRVLVQSDNGDTPASTSTLLFGGNSAGNRRSDQFTWETINSLKFYAHARAAHAVKITSDVRYDQYRSAVQTNPYGTFTYETLADVAQGTPVSFSRSLASPVRSGGAVNGFVSVGDYWRISNFVQVMYGARLEGNTFTSRAPFNSHLQDVLGARTNYAPSSVHVSPRLGFTWLRSLSSVYLRGGPAGSYMMASPRFLRGGIGEFRSMLSPSLLAEPRVASGLPNGAMRLNCIGAATPAADWAAFDVSSAAIPTSCAGSSGSVFADNAPAVQLVAPGYSPPTSWRANLAFGARTLQIDWSLEGLYSLNLHQPGTTDLNFVPTSRFTLGDDQRPVFAPISAIVPGSGLVANSASRATSDYGRVVRSQSDLRSVSRQVTLNVRPSSTIMYHWFLSGAYTFANNRAQARGFDGSTYGSPLDRSWARSDYDVRHQLQVQYGFVSHGVSLAGFTRLQSGLPYTPMVAGDINGDGLNNDRAFIPSTSATAPAANIQQAELRALMASSSRSAKSCLESQMGRVAGRNSCTGPWFMSSNAQLSFSQDALKNRHINSIAINITNPLAAADQLLHGGNNMRGWGSPSIPDATLLTVRGFDPASRQFQYTVNPRFGKPQQYSVLSRAPFRLTLDVSLTLSRPVARQQMDEWTRPGRAGARGTKLTPADFKRHYERNVPDVFKMVLDNTDSLLLNRAQVEALQRAQIPYRKLMDSVWNAFGVELAALDDHFDDVAALKRQETVMDEAWEITRLAVHQQVATVLTRVQIELMVGWVRDLYHADNARNWRMYQFGS